jgi:hypothetical protein
MTPKMTAGRRLREDMTAMLERAAEELGEPNLKWDEREREVIERAAAAADAAEALRKLFATEQGGENRYAVLVKLSAEARACDRQVVDLLTRVNPAEGQAKSERHVRAAKARYDIRLRSV